MSEMPVVDEKTAVAQQSDGGEKATNGNAKPAAGSSAGKQTLGSGLVIPAGVNLEAPDPPPAPVTLEPEELLVENSDAVPPVVDEPPEPAAAEAVDETMDGEGSVLPTTSETGDIPQDKAHSVAERIIAKKTAEIISTVEGPTRSKIPSELSAGDRALYDAALLGRGFSDETYADNKKTGGIPLNESGGGLKIKAADGTEITVLRVSGQDKKDDVVLYYDCVIDPANPGNTTKVAAVDLQKSHLASHATEIGKSFADPAESAVAVWHAKGGEETPPPADVLATVETKLNASPLQEADRLIAQEIVLIEAALAAGSLGEKETAANNKLRAELRLAEVVPGDAGILLKITALKNAQDPEKRPASSDTIQKVLDKLEPQGKKAQEAINQTIEATGQPQKKIEAWKKMELGDLLRDHDFLNLPDMTKQLFGKDLSRTEAADIDAKLEDYAKAGNLTKEQMDAWEKAKTTGKSIGLILAIILAIPAAVVGGAVLATAGAAGQMSKH